MTIDSKKKIIILSIIGILIVFSIGLIVGKLLFGANKEKYVLTGIITSYKNGVMVVQDETTSEYYNIVNVDDEYEIGDTVAIYTKKGIKETYPPTVYASKIHLIEPNSTKENDEAKEDEISKESSESDSSLENNTSSNPSSNSSNGASSKTNTESSSNSSQNLEPSTPKTEEDVVNYVNEIKNTLSRSDASSFGSSIKEGFVTIVDFLFYGGTIHGQTFNSLSNKAKIEVLKAVTTIDNLIDKVFPGYKTTIASKYQSIKSKIVTTYLDITVKICSNNEDICEQAKEDFSHLKNSFGLTWNFLVELAGEGINKLSGWYQVWKHK